MIRALLIASTLVFLTACNSTVIHVTQAGQDVQGAEVFIGDARVGVTDAGGLLLLGRRAVGERIIARLRVEEMPASQPDHVWIKRTYITSSAIDDTGARQDFVITNPAVTQELVLSPSNALVGLHLLVTLAWDASRDEGAEIERMFRETSQQLYNATDGQFVLEQVQIWDNRQKWPSAEIAMYADNTVHPHTPAGGGFFSEVTPGYHNVLYLPFEFMMSDFSTVKMPPEMIVHELGHLVFRLQDEYMGIDSPCTPILELTGPFSDGMPQSSCAMSATTVSAPSRKFCSEHRANPHKPEATPGFASSCWQIIAGAYEDKTAPARWDLITPFDRAQIPGTVPRHPAAWTTARFENFRSPTLELCGPRAFTVAPPVPGVTIWVRPNTRPGMRDYPLGKTNASGKVTIRGVYRGDEVGSGAGAMEVMATDCARERP